MRADDTLQANVLDLRCRAILDQVFKAIHEAALELLALFYGRFEKRQGDASPRAFDAVAVNGGHGVASLISGVARIGEGKRGKQSLMELHRAETQGVPGNVPSRMGPGNHRGIQSRPGPP